MFGKGKQNQSMCPDNNYLHLKTCNLLEKGQFPCTGLPGFLCKEHLQCEWKQVVGRRNREICRQTFAKLWEGAIFSLELFKLVLFSPPPERQISLLRKQQTGEIPKGQKIIVNWYRSSENHLPIKAKSPWSENKENSNINHYRDVLGIVAFELWEEITQFVMPADISGWGQNIRICINASEMHW